MTDPYTSENPISPNTPQKISGVLRNALNLYKKGFLQIFLLVIIYGLWTYFSVYVGLNYFLGKPWHLIYHIFVAFIALLLYAPIIYRLSAIHHQQSISIKEAFEKTIKRLLKLFFASLLYLVSVFFGGVFLIIPGIFLVFSLCFYSLLILLEDKGILDSLSESFDLVRKSWWRTMTVLLIALIIPLSIHTSNLVLTKLSIQFTWQNFSVNTLTTILFTPFFIATMLCQLQDLKLRRQKKYAAQKAASKEEKEIHIG